MCKKTPSSRGYLQHLPLIIDMTKRDLKERYIGTSLGKFWLVLQPLLLLLIYTLVFSKILNVRFESSHNESTFAFYLMAGLIAFNGFSESLTRSVNTLSTNRNLLLNTPLPAWVLPIIPVFSSMVIELISVVLLLVFFVVFESSLSVVVWLYPVLLLSRLLLSLSGSYLLSIFSVFFKDIGQALPMLLTVLLFVSPILYPMSIVPDTYQPLFFWNLMSHVVEAYRAILLEGEIHGSTIAWLLLISSALCIGAVALFQKLINQAKLVL